MARAAQRIRDTVRERHRCSAYCRDGRHVALVWHISTDLATVAEGSRVLCGLLGWRLVGIEAASPEARRPETITTLTPDGRLLEHYDTDERTNGYLMTWE